MNQFSNPHFRFFTQYISHSKTKKFLIETLLEMIDSNSPRFFMPGSILFKKISIGKFFVMD
jgi:hypothetical protein